MLEETSGFRTRSNKRLTHEAVLSSYQSIDWHLTGVMFYTQCTFFCMREMLLVRQLGEKCMRTHHVSSKGNISVILKSLVAHLYPVNAMPPVVIGDHTDSHRRTGRDGQTPRLESDQPAPSLVVLLFS